MKQALFIGAHPDDIEIGAGATVARLGELGWEVWLCTLTEDRDPLVAAVRSNEAQRAAERLGVSASRCLSLGAVDGHLECNANTVHQLRELLTAQGLAPDLVFAHCHEDSHNDHRAAHEVTLATFRKKAILTFPIVNSLLTNFVPHVYVDGSTTWKAKFAALREHQSQSSRIYDDQIDALGYEYGNQLGVEFAEAFGIVVQEGAAAGLGLAQSINECPFNTFWYSTLARRRLVLVHAVAVLRDLPDFRWPVGKDRDGISLLRRAFSQMWVGPDPIQEYSCNDPLAFDFLNRDDVLLSGGAVSNHVTRTYFNHLPGIRYTIDYTMPGYRDILIADRARRVELEASYVRSAAGVPTLLHDKGILSIFRKPGQSDRWLLGCMGIHGYGTMGCFEVLSSRALLAEVNQWMQKFEYGMQVIVDHDVRRGVTVIDWDSVERIVPIP